MRGLHAGDLLTICRVVITPVFVVAFCRALDSTGPRWLPGVMFVAASASDYFDGILARRAGRASARGRVLDSMADITFLLGGLGGAWLAGVVPWWVPAAIAASFVYYVIDSWVLTRVEAERTLVRSSLGHWAGVMNYALVGVLVFNEAGGLHVLAPVTLQALFYLVPLYSAAAVASRIRWR